MQEHICRTLVHFLIFIGSRLNLQISLDAERSVLSSSYKAWQTVLFEPQASGELCLPRYSSACFREIAPESTLSEQTLSKEVFSTHEAEALGATIPDQFSIQTQTWTVDSSNDANLDT